jgi:enoyl-[acyl-carrier protein] reductase III
MTSSGGRKQWPSYGAVSMAKATLESASRQLAIELAHKGISVNAIQAGVTDTPALRKIPGNQEMIDYAINNNPSKRLTTPEDIAEYITLFTKTNNSWMTGNIIRLDGGEDIIG